MLAVVAALTVHFYFANRSQRKGGNVLENMVRILLLSHSASKAECLLYSGWFPFYILIDPKIDNQEKIIYLRMAAVISKCPRDSVHGTHQHNFVICFNFSDSVDKHKETIKKHANHLCYIRFE
jgi:hypothetical protein